MPFIRRIEIPIQFTPDVTKTKTPTNASTNETTLLSLSPLVTLINHVTTTIHSHKIDDECADDENENADERANKVTKSITTLTIRSNSSCKNRNRNNNRFGRTKTATKTASHPI